MQVNVHFGLYDENVSITQELSFLTVPQVGEYFATSLSREAPLYRVLDVVHFISGNSWDAEIYVIEVDRQEAEKRYRETHLKRKEKVVHPQF